MKASTEELLRCSLLIWVAFAAVHMGITAGVLFQKWPEPTGWDAPSQLANSSHTWRRLEHLGAIAKTDQ